MRKHRLNAFWEPHSIMIAMTYNLNKAKHKKSMKPFDVNPYADKSKFGKHKRVNKEFFFSALKAAFIPKGK